jgi:perosamine synthetase
MVEKFGFKEGDFPVTEYVANRTIALPFFARMTDSQIDQVVEKLNVCLERRLTAHRPRF